MVERSEFENLRDRLDAILAPVKFRLAEEVYSPASFGSMHAVWSRRGMSVRLIWDGKDSTLLIEADAGDGWETLGFGSPSEAERLLDTARAYVA